MTFPDRLESLAAKATKGKWKHLSMGVKTERAEANGRTFVAGTHNQERIYTNHDGGTTPSFDADYIECVQPSVGLAVARALRAAANVGPVLYAYLHEQDTNDHNLRALKEEVESALAALEATEGA